MLITMGLIVAGFAQDPNALSMQTGGTGLHPLSKLTPLCDSSARSRAPPPLGNSGEGMELSCLWPSRNETENGLGKGGFCSVFHLIVLQPPPNSSGPFVHNWQQQPEKKSIQESVLWNIILKLQAHNNKVPQHTSFPAILRCHPLSVPCGSCSWPSPFPADFLFPLQPPPLVPTLFFCGNCSV